MQPKAYNLPFFSYKIVLLLRRMLSVLELAAAVQHSWSFSLYMNDLLKQNEGRQLPTLTQI